MSKAKRTAKAENPAFSPETSKPSSTIEFDPRLLERLRRLSREERREIGEVVTRIALTLGKPHEHAGVGLRKLSGAYFEGRAGLRLRLIFEVLKGGALYFHLLGDHEEVRRFLKRKA